jgi:hypothetical protein
MPTFWELQGLERVVVIQKEGPEETPILWIKPLCWQKAEAVELVLLQVVLAVPGDRQPVVSGI